MLFAMTVHSIFSCKTIANWLGVEHNLRTGNALDVTTKREWCSDLMEMYIGPTEGWVLLHMIVVVGNIYKYHLDSDKNTKGPIDWVNGSGY